LEYSRNKEAYAVRSKQWRANNKEQQKQNMRQWYFNNTERQKEYHRQRKYGISTEEYAAMLQAQNNCCAICGGGFDDQTPVVDHKHDTNKIRGLLCSRCNVGIGMLGDSVDNLLSAAEYLDRVKVGL
jgi:5-methylcytosine-specific restriction endonuclease McrA